MLKLWANNRNENTIQMKTLNRDEFIWFLSDFVMNVLSGVVLINKLELNKFEKPLRKLADRRDEKSERIEIFRSDPGIRLIKLIALLKSLRQMYANEQPQVI